MNKMTKQRAEKIYQQVAVQNHTTVDKVKKEIKLAMLIGMCNQDPAIQKRWSEIPHDGEVLTPEELLIYLSSCVEKDKNGDIII